MIDIFFLQRVSYNYELFPRTKQEQFNENILRILIQNNESFETSEWVSVKTEEYVNVLNCTK